MQHPLNGDVARYSDKYFIKTKAIVERFGDFYQP